MMRFEWNSLRVGDPVRVHVADGYLSTGTVAFVDSLHGSNGVGISVVSADGSDKVSWPSRVSVHGPSGDTNDPGEVCLRCASLVDGGRS